MIEAMEKGYRDEEVASILHPFVKEWFFSKFKNFSQTQLYGVMEVHLRNNILISAPTGGTKCVTPDTSFLIEHKGETKIIQAEELVRAAQSEGKFIQNVDKTGKLYDLPSLHCFSLDNGKIRKNKSLVYFENTDDILLKINTEYGREVKLSRDHPLLVETGEGAKWIRAQDVKVGDRIAISKNVPLPEKQIYFDCKKAIHNARGRAKSFVDYSDFVALRQLTRNFTFFDNLSTDEFYKIKIILRLRFDDIRNKTGISVTSIYNHFNKKASIQNVRKLHIFFKNEFKKINFEKNRIILASKSGKIHSFLYPIKADRRLVRWLAFVQAEGLIGDYKQGTPLLISQKNRMDLLQEFFKDTKNLFDLKFRKKKGSDKDFEIGSTSFCYFLCDLLDLKRGRGRKVPIPSWVLNMSKELKANFIHVFFSLEGTITEKGIEVDQANKQKIETLNYLLLSFGILSSLRRKICCATNTLKKIKRTYYGIYIYGLDNLKNFLMLIDIDHPRRDQLWYHVNNDKISGVYVNKFRFDYKKIRSLSFLYENDISFNKDLKNIYEVVRRTGYITLSALGNLKNILLAFNDPIANALLNEINHLIDGEIAWVRVIKKRAFKYKGLVVDITVPNVHNFIGGYGGLILHNTLTAFLAIINELVTLADKNQLEDKVYAVYCSPLKALSNDISINLQKPLEEIEKIAESNGKKLNIRVGLRTGDTSTAERAKMLRKVPHILVTTSESLGLMLASPKFSLLLHQVQWGIIDEIHSFSENKRGVHLSLSMERLQQLSMYMTRVGLSATIAPLEEIAKFLVGNNRPCKIADVQLLKKFDLKVMSPLPDLINANEKKLQDALYGTLDNLIQTHKTTLIFTNTRAGTERVVHHLKERFPKNYTENLAAHHGSLSKKHRLDIEDNLRAGKLKCCVTSTALELGIDIGYIDLVVCLGSPKSVARLSQRAGRSGHALHSEVKGRLVVMDRDDLVECSVMLKAALEKKIDRIHIPTNCLDVLAQQIYGFAIQQRWKIDELFAMIKQSYCYKNLTYHDFMQVISYLAGDFASLEDRHIYAKIWYDKETGELGKRGKIARLLYMTNIGTIPDEAHVQVKVKEDVIGTIDEAFLERLKRGEIFILGGNTYEFLFARGMVAQVRPAPEKKPTVPSWFSEMLPLSFDLAMEIQKFRRYMQDYFENKKNKNEIIEFIHSYLYVNEVAAEAIYNYFWEQYHYLEIPHDQKLLVEHYNEEKKKYVVFHSLFGRRVNDVLSRAVAYAVGKLNNKDVELGFNDNGFYIATDRPAQIMRAFDLLKAEQLRAIMERAIDKSEVLRRRFRHCAGRSLMILREYKGQRKRVGRQQVSSMILLHAVKRISEDFPILKEARREVLEDLMDIEHAIWVLQQIQDRKIEVKEVNTSLPSPFAFNLVLEGYTDIMKMEDKLEFLRRMHLMVLAKIGKKYAE